MSILIKNASYLIRNNNRIENGKDILIEGAHISKIARLIEVPANTEIIDATGKLVAPGFINSHTHLYQNLLKGMDDRVSLFEWVDKITFPLCSNITTKLNKKDSKKIAHLWSLLAGIEAIKSGTTCVLDMDLKHIDVIRGWNDLGLRGVCARTFVDKWVPNDLAEPLKKQFKNIEKLIKTYHNTPQELPLISVFIGPSAIFTCSEKLLKWVAETAEEFDTGIQIHVAETSWEVEFAKKEMGLRPIEYLHKMGFLSPRTSLVHCVHLSENEISIIAESGATVVHCPKSNMKLGSGVAPVVEMIKRNIPVALGTDGAASNDLLDMLEEMRFAAMLQKVKHEDASVITGNDVYKMATANGAKVCNIDAGAIEEGKLADLIIVDLNKAHLVPIHDIINTLVYCGRASDVESVVINGKIVMLERSIKTVNENNILEEIAAMKSYFE
jgi:5-methylthioadenosine/S-adenosylhomocysteine deaminase